MRYGSLFEFLYLYSSRAGLLHSTIRYFYKERRRNWNKSFFEAGVHGRTWARDAGTSMISRLDQPFGDLVFVAFLHQKIGRTEIL